MMTSNIKLPKEAVIPAFLKQKPKREDLELFQKEFQLFIGSINEAETEEYNKNLLRDFLNNVYYKNDYDINVYNDTKNKIRVDFAIKQKNNPLAEVFMEIKRPTNQSEMPNKTNLDKRGMHELLLYYMSERIINNNKSLSHLIVTNLYEWFVFDAKDFYTLFYSDKQLKSAFERYNKGQLEGDKTIYFYEEIAPEAIQKIQDEINFVYFDLREYQDMNADDEDCIALYKFLSPVHLLKKDVTLDANRLNKEFYNELLHILGLIETQSEGKIKIERNIKTQLAGSLLELTIAKLETTDLSQFASSEEHAANREEQLFSISLSLIITWINRILFLKLLEAQLLKYHNNNSNYAFFSTEKITDYSRLDALFFQVLAQPTNKRYEIFNEFKHVPYLNSSLFEESDAEKILKISSLLNGVRLPLYEKSVLAAKKYDALQYLLKFLNAYNFSGRLDKGDDPDKLINSAVLGLIFEKINGYKDGSFFTPSFVTMYMCRETIGRAIVQKFNKAKKWNCQSIKDVYNKIENISEANEIFNSIRICEPAVGSGHFLVSALNELIYLKSELEILVDKNGKRLKNYKITVENDELIIRCDDGSHFEYKPQNEESQRVQETLFIEKLIIIENCLFGVDINPNSVQICRLRLWIELLKHTFYKSETGELETLPNIDINIKCGDSLMSRFTLDDKYFDDLRMKQKVKVSAKKYRELVAVYKRCHERSTKREIEKNIDAERAFLYQINSIKDPDFQAMQKAKRELAQHSIPDSIFDTYDNEWNEKTAELTENARKYEAIYNEKIRGCFEWRFEFPEVLDDDGNFTGFDLVIGNPPYISAPAMVEKNPKVRKALIDSNRYSTLYQKWDLYIPFMELGLQLLIENGMFAMIVPYPLTNQIYAKKIRELIINKCNMIEIVDLTGTKVFDRATVSNCIPFVVKSQLGNACFISHINEQKQITRTFRQSYSDLVQDKKNAVWNLTNEKRETSRHSEMNVLGDFCYISVGMVLNADEKTAKGEFAKDDLISETYNAVHCKKYIEAKDIERYRVNKIRYLEYNTERCPDKLRRPTFRELYENPKLMFNRLGSLKVFYDDETKFLHSDSMFSAVLWKDFKGIDNKSIKASVKRYSRYSREEMELYSEQIDLRYLLGILNSKYASVLLSAVRGGDYHIYPEHLRNMPIPLVDKTRQEPVIALVNQILFAKKENHAADTLELERKIDELVYELYGLTEEFNSPSRDSTRAANSRNLGLNLISSSYFRK